jgi:subtilisin family serine protease
VAASRAERRRYPVDEILVKFRANASALDRAGLRGRLGAAVRRTFRTGAEHWRLSWGPSVEELVRDLNRNPIVEYAEPNYYLKTFDVPDDPLFPQQWGLRNTGEGGGLLDADIDADLAWEITAGEDVVIAVLDSGVDYTHPDFESNLWFNPGEIPDNFQDDDGNGFVDDIHGADFIRLDGRPLPYDPFPSEPPCPLPSPHGTIVAGIAAARGNNSIGISGVGRASKVMALRILHQSNTTEGTVADATQAVQYAIAEGALVANASWGIMTPPCTYMQDGICGKTLYDAIAAGQAAGFILVASAGNLDQNIDDPNEAAYPAAYDLDNVITVAATDKYDLRAFFSNYGPTTVDLGAPGMGILSLMSQYPCAGTPHSYGGSSGTSMSAPHVAGALALMRSLDLEPTPTVAELKCRLLTTTDPLPSLIFRTVSGGRLNARRALDSLLAGAPCIEPENFQFTATIYGSPNPQYEQINLISLPYGNVFQGPGGPEALCEALGLSNNAELAQYDSAGNRLVHGCGGSPTFELLDLKGVEIIERHPGAKQGIIEGWDVPGAQIVIEDLGAGKIGHNLFPVRYNGTAQTPEDLCDQCGLSSQAMITRFNAAGGTVQSHVCGQLPLWNLVLGEAVLIQEPNGPVTCTPQAYE